MIRDLILGSILTAPQYIGNRVVTGGSPSVAVPAGTGVGDLLIAWCQVEPGTEVWTLPAGWTEIYKINTLSRAYVLCYFFDDGTGPYVFTSTTGGYTKDVVMMSFRNAQYASDVGMSTADTAFNPSGTCTVASLTTNELYAIALSICAYPSSSSIPTPSGMTSIASDATARSYRIARQTFATAGATGDKSTTFTAEGTFNVTGVFITLKFKP